MRRRLHVLETELGSKVFLSLLENPDGISGYDIAKKVYAKKTFNPNKIYEVLYKMKKEGLIVKSKSEERKRKLLNRLNYDGLVDVIDQFLVDRLTLTEKKEVKNVLRHFDIIFRLHEIGIGKKLNYSEAVGNSLETVLSLLKSFSEFFLEGSVLSKSMKRKGYQRVGNLMGFGSVSKSLTGLVMSFRECSESTLEKLSSLPESYLHSQTVHVVSALKFQSKSITEMVKNLSKKR